MTRKFLREMLDEARSKDQQIKGQQAMLDQKIKAEYDNLTKDVPPPSPKKKKRKIETTGTGASPYQVYKAPPAGNYVPAPKRTNEQYLREFGEWAPIETSAPTNSATTTFGYFIGGSPAVNYETGDQITFTYNGLDGIANYPTSITVDQGFGEVHTTNPPPFSQVGVQGYTAKLNPRYKEAQKKYEQEMKAWLEKEEQQQRDIEATLKNLGTSLRDVQQKGGGITKVGNSYVAIIPQDTSSLFDLMNNVRIVRLVPCDPSKPMELNRNVVDISGVKKWEVTNAQYADDIYLGIGQQPDPPMESEYLMPRRNGFNDINPQLDASQEFAQEIGADVYMDARVQGIEDMPDTPTFADTGTDAPTDPNTVTPEDEAFIDYMERYPNLVNFLLPGQAAAATSVINYARGNYSDITQSPGRSANQSILDIISRVHDGGTSGSVTAALNPGQDPSEYNMDRAYPHGPLNSPMRNFLNQFNYEVTSDGVRIKDTFNFNGNRNTGFLGNIPIKGPDGRMIRIQDVADRLSDIGDRRARSMGLDPASDSFGGKIDFTIPWNEVPARIQNQLDPTQTISPTVKRNRRGRKVKVRESTWDKMNRLLGEDYKNLPRDRMAKQYDRKKDKNFDEFHKQNPMGIGPRVSRGKSDTQIDQHGNSRQTKAISGQLKNNPRFYDSSHEQWQRMQSKFKSTKNSDATGEVVRRLNPSRKKKKL